MLKSRIPRITSEMLPAVTAALRHGAEQVADAARARVPVDTGGLRDSIHVVRDGDLEFMVLAGDDDTFYGHIVENGGAHTGPRPFMVPAAQATAGQVTGDVRAAIRRAVS